METDIVVISDDEDIVEEALLPKIVNGEEERKGQVEDSAADARVVQDGQRCFLQCQNGKCYLKKCSITSPESHLKLFSYL